MAKTLTATLAERLIKALAADFKVESCQLCRDAIELFANTVATLSAKHETTKAATNAETALSSMFKNEAGLITQGLQNALPGLDIDKEIHRAGIVADIVADDIRLDDDGITWHRKTGVNEGQEQFQQLSPEDSIIAATVTPEEVAFVKAKLAETVLAFHDFRDETEPGGQPVPVDVPVKRGRGKIDES